MIAYFPALYPDELLYSVLARFFIHSGYTSFANLRKEIYQGKTSFPNALFVDDNTEEIKNILTVSNTVEDIFLKHTMFPYYYRFLSNTEMNKAYDSVEKFCKSDQSLTPKKLFTSNRIFSLRYCPICAQNDREKYGETYWHCIHQIEGVNICPIHNCVLKNSEAAIKYKKASSLYAAEELIPEKSAAQFIKDPEYISLVKYFTNVYRSDFIRKSETSVSELLYSKLYETKYISPDSNKRDLTSLSSDLNSYYSEFTENITFDKESLHQFFSSPSLDFSDVCLLGFYLGVLPKELTERNKNIPKKVKSFDNMILELYRKNMSFNQIADRLDSTYDYVFNVCICDPMNKTFRFRFDSARYGK